MVLIRVNLCKSPNAPVSLPNVLLANSKSCLNSLFVFIPISAIVVKACVSAASACAPCRVFWAKPWSRLKAFMAVFTAPAPTPRVPSPTTAPKAAAPRSTADSSWPSSIECPDIASYVSLAMPTGVNPIAISAIASAISLKCEKPSPS